MKISTIFKQHHPWNEYATRSMASLNMPLNIYATRSMASGGGFWLEVNQNYTESIPSLNLICNTEQKWSFKPWLQHRTEQLSGITQDPCQEPQADRVNIATCTKVADVQPEAKTSSSPSTRTSLSSWRRDSSGDRMYLRQVTSSNNLIRGWKTMMSHKPPRRQRPQQLWRSRIQEPPGWRRSTMSFQMKDMMKTKTIGFLAEVGSPKYLLI